MSEVVNDLKRCIKQYREVDDDIRIMNKMLWEKRETRKIVELELIDIVKLPQFSSYEKLKIEDDGSTIKIQKPNTYSKPWSLSKKELQNVLVDYFSKNQNPNATDCFKHICELRKIDLIAADFSFTRIVSEEETS
jgi:hypothetical protein